MATRCGYSFGAQNQQDMDRAFWINNASHGHVSGIYEYDTNHILDPITLTADPWDAVGSDDYEPNTTSGGGDSLRAAAMRLHEQTFNFDLGAVQHADPAGGSGGNIWSLKPA